MEISNSQYVLFSIFIINNYLIIGKKNRERQTWKQNKN